MTIPKSLGQQHPVLMQDLREREAHILLEHNGFHLSVFVA